MIQVLLHDKLKKCDRSPYEVEDLLTSVVFGALEYCNRNEELLKFLKKAINVYGNNKIDDILQKVEDVRYEFWPDWKQKQEIEVADSNNISDKQIALGSEPDILLKIKRDNNEAWILVEVKLESGKSCGPTSEGPITDQLAKYWLQLKKRAEKNNAEPIALIYVTKYSMPKEDFDEAKGELESKTEEPIRNQFYWLSWREFPNCISEDSPRILQDVKKLLMEKWQLIPTEPMKEWPKIIDTMIIQWNFTPFVLPDLNMDVLPKFEFHGSNPNG